MAKSATTGVKLTSINLDENAEVLGGENYIGDLPPARKALPGQIRRVYVNNTNNGDPVLKVLYEVTEGQYAGFTAWDNVTLNNKAAFKWRPLVDSMGISVRDLISDTRVNPDDESEAGLRVVGIGGLDLSGDHGVPVFFGVEYAKYDGVQQTRVAGVKPRKVTSVATPDAPQNNAGNADGPF